VLGRCTRPWDAPWGAGMQGKLLPGLLCTEEGDARPADLLLDLGAGAQGGRGG